MIQNEDTSTVVSIFPKSFREVKPGLNPNIFDIPACVDINDPVLVYIPPAIHNVYIGENRNFPVSSPSFEVAKAIVFDIINSILESGTYSTTYGQPGLLAVPNKVQKHELKVKYKDEIDEMKNSQLAWAKKIVKVADDDWQQFHKHIVISDTQRLMAKYLGLSGREWMEVTVNEVSVKCPACTSIIAGEALVCPICKTIVKPEEFKKFQRIA